MGPVHRLSHTGQVDLGEHDLFGEQGCLTACADNPAGAATPDTPCAIAAAKAAYNNIT